MNECYQFRLFQEGGETPSVISYVVRIRKLLLIVLFILGIYPIMLFIPGIIVFTFNCVQGCSKVRAAQATSVLTVVLLGQ